VADRIHPEVIDVLVRIMKGAVDPEQLTERAALGILAMCADQRTAAHMASTWLNEHGGGGHGLTFEQIVERLKAEFGVNVHRATVARWAQPPGPDRRRRRRSDSDE
jgi:hypothetical protein